MRIYAGFLGLTNDLTNDLTNLVNTAIMRA